MVEDLNSFLEDEFVCSEYRALDQCFCGALTVLMTRLIQCIAEDPKRREAVLQLDGLLRSKHMFIDTYSQLGRELVEE